MKAIPWSHSSLQAFENCPRAFYEIKVAKNFIEDWSAPHLLWGNKVHKALELRVGFGTPLPENMQAYERLAFTLANAPGHKFVEHETAITIDGAPANYWNDPTCWHRGKDDIKIINETKALVGDYKTGKETDDEEQLKLAAVRVFANHDKVEIVKAAYFFLQTGTVKKHIYVRDNIPDVLEKYKTKVSAMEWAEKHNAWPAKPSGLCRKSKKPGSTYGGCIVATCPFSEHYKGNR